MRKRYGADYDISVHDDRKGAPAALESASAKHLAVALVLSAFGPNDADGIEFFDDVRPLHSEAKRVAVVRWGDFHTVRPIFNAITLGQLDHWLMAPEYSPDEEFHRSVTEFLEYLEIRYRASGRERKLPAAALFVLIGSQPRTDWLRSAVVRDKWGFIATGPDLTPGPVTTLCARRCPGPNPETMLGPWSVIPSCSSPAGLGLRRWRRKARLCQARGGSW